MAETFLLKDIYNPDLVKRLGEIIHTAFDWFDTTKLLIEFKKDYEALELKERSQFIADLIWSQVNTGYISFITGLVNAFPEELGEQEMEGYDGFMYMPISMIVVNHGMEESHIDVSLNVLEEVTRRFTAEFAIRYFIEQYPVPTFSKLNDWVVSDNHHVRRLVSEGLRPKLPWGMQLKSFVKNPDPIFFYLSKLVKDPSLYVRRSVANNLNDISKDHPQKVIDFLSDYTNDDSKETQWLIKHALRTLIKQRNKGALSLIGIDPVFPLTNFSFHIDRQKVRIGEALNIEVNCQAQKQGIWMIDYAIHFLRANGKHNEKVFKGKQLKVRKGEIITWQKNQPFKPISTRRYYSGEHFIEIFVNGVSRGKISFELVDA